MKYCPRCGSLIEGTINCIECGFVVDNKELENNFKDINIISNKNLYTKVISIEEEYNKIQNNCSYKISIRHNE